MGTEIRIGKAIMVLGMGLFMGLAAVNNLLSSQGAYGAVNMVVSMGGTFQDPAVMWRAVETPAIVWLGVAGIILTEAIAAFFCFCGGYNLLRARQSQTAFLAARSKAIIGLTITAALYFIGFQVIAGEWFMLWQNREVGTLQEAFRNFVPAMLLMLWISSPDPD